MCSYDKVSIRTYTIHKYTTATMYTYNDFVIQKPRNPSKYPSNHQ